MGKPLGCLCVLALVAFIVVGFVIRWGPEGNRDDHYRTLAEGLRARTTHPSGKVINSTATTWTQFSARSSWDVETKQRWTQYVEWVRSQLTTEFEQLPMSETDAVFTKHVPGDAYSVSLVKVFDGPPLRVRVTFHAMAN